MLAWKITFRRKVQLTFKFKSEEDLILPGLKLQFVGNYVMKSIRQFLYFFTELVEPRSSEVYGVLKFMSKNTRRLENTLRPVVRLTMRGPTNWRSTTRGPTSSNLPTLSNQILTKSLYSLIHGCIFLKILRQEGVES